MYSTMIRICTGNKPFSLVDVALLKMIFDLIMYLTSYILVIGIIELA